MRRLLTLLAATVPMLLVHPLDAAPVLDATLELEPASEQDGVFRLAVSGLRKAEPAPLLRSESAPVFQVVPVRTQDGGWAYLGRYHAREPDRFVLLAAAAIEPRELASIEPQRIERRSPRPTEQWLRARLEHLRRDLLSPGEMDGFWRYQEAYLQGRLEAAELRPPRPRTWRPRRPQGFLGSLELVTGLAAVEESLQLSVLRDASPLADEPFSVSVSELSGPVIQSHDFAELRRGLASGPIPPTAAFAPEDSLYAGFASLPQALRFTDQLDLAQRGLSRLSSMLYTEDSPASFVQRLGLRLTPELRPVYGLVVGAMALIVDDPYLAEGADLTLILEARSEAALDLRVAQLDRETLAAHPGLAFRDEAHGAHRVRVLHSADGSVRSYRADVGAYRLFATSRGALARVLDAWDGRLARLADAEEFAYVRAVLPGGDGFAYVSDACVRRFVSPAFKLAELRRVRCLANLRVLDHATDLSDMEANPHRSVEALRGDGYLAQPPRCPQHGDYAYDADAQRFRCSVHGTSADLAHLSELPVERVTATEAELYRQFVRNYSVYWPRYFDPIGVQIDLEADRLRLSTCILPLIESTTYRQFRTLAGGAPRALAWGSEALERFGGLLSLKLTAFDGYRPDLSHIEDVELRDGIASLRNWIANALPWGTERDILSWIGPEASFVLVDSDAESLASLSRSAGALRLAVVDAPLAEHLLHTWQRFTPRWWAPAAQDELPPGVRVHLQGAEGFDEAGLLLTDEALLVLWGKPDERRALAERLLAQETTAAPRPGTAAGANVLFGLDLARLPAATRQTLAAAERKHVAVCRCNLARLEDLCTFEAFAAGSVAEVLARTRSVSGLSCPDAGRYERAGAEVRCSVHGTLRQPVTLELPPAGAPLAELLARMAWLRASLTFTPEGIRTSLELPLAP